MKKYEKYTKEQLIQKIKQLESKKYGLIWDDEKEPEKVVVECQNNIPILKKIDEKTIKTDIKKPTNILIEGDNYHALQVLNYTHKGQIDVIYIDPPYNTGNKDFKYNDSFIDKEDGYRHSKWLNFMSKRLKLAHNLLKDDGIMFISIDDNEVAQLKLLCADIFGEKNTEQYLWDLRDFEESSFTKTASNTVRFEHEYIIACYKNIKKLYRYKEFRFQNREDFSNIDNDIRGDWMSGNISRNGIKSTAGSKYFTITTPTGEKYTRNWTISESEYTELLNDNRIYFSKNGSGVPRLKIFKNEYSSSIQSSIFSGLKTSITGKNQIKELFNDNIMFDFPKPTTLIKRLIELSGKQNLTILDFFAGSGTTGHSVLELNKEDRGNRQFILCTNNENSICEEVTYPRISKVINGYINPKGVDVDGISGNLDYYKTDLIPTNGISNITDSTREELTKKAGNMIAIKENTHCMIELCEHYQIFINEATKKQTAIYFTEDLSCFDELIEKTKSHFTKLYIFSFGKIDKSSYKYLGKNYQIEDIPEPIIEIYKEINKEGIL